MKYSHIYLYMLLFSQTLNRILVYFQSYLNNFQLVPFILFLSSFFSCVLIWELRKSFHHDLVNNHVSRVHGPLYEARSLLLHPIYLSLRQAWTISSVSPQRGCRESQSRSEQNEIWTLTRSAINPDRQSVTRYSSTVSKTECSINCQWLFFWEQYFWGRWHSY